MRIGNVVQIRKMSNVLGEVLAIGDDDMVTLSLCDVGIKIKASIDDLVCTGAKQPNMDDGKEVHILGTVYKIRIIDEEDYRASKDADGWADYSTKEIYVYNYRQDVNSLMDLVAYQKKVIRHEIVHAFFYESGLWCNSLDHKCWARNEEMVDWIAIQEPKIHKAFKEVGAL